MLFHMIDNMLSSYFCPINTMLRDTVHSTNPPSSRRIAIALCLWRTACGRNKLSIGSLCNAALIEMFRQHVLTNALSDTGNSYEFNPHHPRTTTLLGKPHLIIKMRTTHHPQLHDMLENPNPPKLVLDQCDEDRYLHKTFPREAQRRRRNQFRENTSSRCSKRHVCRH